MVMMSEGGGRGVGCFPLFLLFFVRGGERGGMEEGEEGEEEGGGEYFFPLVRVL